MFNAISIYHEKLAQHELYATLYGKETRAQKRITNKLWKQSLAESESAYMDYFQRRYCNVVGIIEKHADYKPAASFHLTIQELLTLRSIARAERRFWLRYPESVGAQKRINHLDMSLAMCGLVCKSGDLGGHSTAQMMRLAMSFMVRA